jgi:hypothetical protein
MRRFLALSLMILLCVSAVGAVTIKEEDIDASFAAPCSLQLSQNGGTRTLTWSAVSGASFYRVGYRPAGGGAIVGLSETTALSYNHVGWNPNVCLEYILVAYNASGSSLCSGHVTNVGACQ